MAEKRRFLGEYLVERGIISQEQLQRAIEEGKKTNRKIGDILVKWGYAKEENIAQALSEQLGIAFIDVLTYQFDPASVNLINGTTAKRLQAIPVYKITNSLTVAMSDPLNVDAIDELEKLTRLSINPVFATPSGINEVINKYYSLQGKGAKERTPAVRPGSEFTYEPSENSEELPKLIEEATKAPVIKLVDQIISDAVRLRASDIHLEPQEKGFYYRYRVDGILKDFISLPHNLQSAVISRIKIMANINIAEKRLPQDGRIQMDIAGKEVDLRVATFPTIYGEHVAVRVLDKSAGILKLEELGLRGDILEKFKTLIKRPFGIILVTGPTGSGKSTTLYSVLNSIRDSKKNIITLEDPVEYSIDHIHQSQVNVKAGLTFATGLRSIVRLDPDIIMIGEIRDKETAEIAIQAALTGHLVFSTLHTNDASSACARLIDIGLEPYLVASSLTAVLAQRLVRKLCAKCKVPNQPTSEDFARFGFAGSQGEKTFYREKGCRECDQTGFSGRTGIYELLLPTDKIKDLIVKKMPAHEIQKEAIASGMKTLREDGLDKVTEGLTTISEVLRATEEAYSL